MTNRIIFINRFFFPDYSANSQLLSDLTFHLASLGKEVHVITSQQLYEAPRARLPHAEIVAGVNIHRLSTTEFGRSGLLGRSIDYLSFYGSLWRFLSKLVNAGDILVATTDPPLLSVVAMRAIKRRGGQLVNWLQDLYPEVAIKLGVPFLNGPIGKAMTRIRDRSLHAAKANIVVGKRMAERLVSCGIDPERVLVIRNWTDDEQIHPIDNKENPLRLEWGLEHRFVVGYSGNLGRPHEFETLLAAAERLRNNREILFLLIGGGHRVPELTRLVQARGLSDSFRLLPYQDKALLKYSLSVVDVHWVSLKAELDDLMFPSKFFGIAAAGRPIIAIASRDGEIANLVRHHACGVAIEPGNADSLVDAIMLLSSDRQRLAEMGRRGRLMLDAHFTRRQALQRWQYALSAISESEARE
jgi:glycosyltransferase involved in cell wall biosynthesis